MKEVGGACGSAGVSLERGIDCQHSAWGTLSAFTRQMARTLRRASRIACAWIGLSEAVGFRAPPAARAREVPDTSQPWLNASSAATARSPKDLLSAAVPPVPSYRASVLNVSNISRGKSESTHAQEQSHQTAEDPQPPTQHAAAAPTLPLSLPPQTEPEESHPVGAREEIKLDTRSPSSSSGTSAASGLNLFREVTIRPAPSATIANPALAEIARFSDARRSGPLTYVLRLTQSAIHDSNVAASATTPRQDLQLSIGPSVLAQLGNEETRWRVGGAYLGAFTDFVNRSAQQTFDHLGTLSINSNTNRIRFSLQTSAHRLTSSFPDIGERVTRTTFYGAGTMVCKWSEKLSSELNADFTDSTFDRFLSSKEYRLQSLHLYEFSAKTRIGLGSAVGRLIPSLGDEQSYVQGLARVEYRPTEKLFFNALCGLDRREFETSSTHSINPVYQGVASWSITPKTSLTINAGRRSFSSARLAFQNFAVSTTGISLSHQLTHSISASITGEYDKSIYSSTASTVRADRIDHYYRGRFELAWALKRWISAGSFLEISENDSQGEGAQPFSRTRVGITLNLSF